MLKQQLQWLIMILDVLCHYDCKIPPKLLTVSINASCFYHNACILALELNMLHINKKDRFWYCSCPNTIFFSPEQTPYFGSHNCSPTLETPKATDLYPLT